MAVLIFWATRHSGNVKVSTNKSGRATRRDHRSGFRTARVLGKTSHPIKISASKPTIVQSSGHRPLSAVHKAVASIAAVAKVLPKTIVASKSCGCASKRTTTPPVRGSRSANCRACHLLSENRAVSASAKKKLAPAKNKTTTTAAISAGSMALSMEENRQNGKKQNGGGD